MTALSEGTVVVEGAVRSGALNTAQWTTNLHRPVLGVPGPVTSAASTGVNQMIRNGQAIAITNAQEAINDITAHTALREAPEVAQPAPATWLREPYVGEGIDGCLRSAQIAREEADGLDLRDPRFGEVLASADRWEQQAEQLGRGTGGVRRPEVERRGTIHSAPPGHGLGR